MEKPTAIDTEQTIQLIKYARIRELFFTTNYWTRQFPIYVLAKQLINLGHIGEVKSIRGDLGFQAVYNDSDYYDRFFNPQLGGGAMNDLGGYLISYFLEFSRSPLIPLVRSEGEKVGDVDTAVSFLLGKSGVFSVSILRDSSFDVQLLGSHGIIDFKASAIAPSTIDLTVRVDANSRNASLIPFPCCAQPLAFIQKFHYSLPNSSGFRCYPGTAGFLYMVQSIEDCFSKGGCQQLPGLTDDDQILISKITDQVLEKMES